MLLRSEPRSGRQTETWAAFIGSPATDAKEAPMDNAEKALIEVRNIKKFYKARGTSGLFA